jgi:hypothetical protein
MNKSCARIWRSPIVVLDDFDGRADRNCVEPTAKRQGHLRLKRANQYLVSAATKLIEYRHEGIEVTSRRRRVSEYA